MGTEAAAFADASRHWRCCIALSPAVESVVEAGAGYSSRPSGLVPAVCGRAKHAHCKVNRVSPVVTL